MGSIVLSNLLSEKLVWKEVHECTPAVSCICHKQHVTCTAVAFGRLDSAVYFFVTQSVQLHAALRPLFSKVHKQAFPIRYLLYSAARHWLCARHDASCALLLCTDAMQFVVSTTLTQYALHCT